MHIHVGDEKVRPQLKHPQIWKYATLIITSSLPFDVRTGQGREEVD